MAGLRHVSSKFIATCVILCVSLRLRVHKPVCVYESIKLQ